MNMIFLGDRQSNCLRLQTLIFPLVLFLFGCASAPQKSTDDTTPGRLVDGAGTSDDRTIIQKSNQQIFNTVNATSTGNSSPVVNQGVP
jgi:hypothetical protein